MSSRNFLKGAFILSIAGIIVKIMGALYRIPLARLIGGEGIGLYQMAYPIYTMLLALSTAGIPVAISILVSEKRSRNDDQGAKRVFLVSLSILAVVGLLFTLLLVLSSKWLAAYVLFDTRAFYALIAVAPAILVTAISSAFRGYFQGNQTMVPTALSQVVEQFIRVATVLALAYIFLPRGIEFAAAGAAFGAVTGSLAALFVLVVAYISFRNKRQKNNPFSLTSIYDVEPIISLTKRIVALALPISIGGLVVPIMQVVDATIIPTRLQDAGHSIARATELFGQFSGMANVLINLPPIITISIAVSLVPAISEAMAKNQIEEARYRINLAMWMTFLIGLPASAGLFILAAPIAEMLFKIPEVGQSIAVLAPSALLLGLYQTTRGALQGLGKTYLPVINLTVGIIIKGSLNYILVGIPTLGIIGAGIATVTGFTASVLLNYYHVKKHTGFKMNWKRNVTIPLICTTLMAILAFLVYDLAVEPLGNTLSVVIAITAGILVYSFSLLFLGGVKVRDLNTIPKIGPRIARFLTRLKIFKV
ncbi:MAG: stage V sporulation protein B [Clostridia bacterium]|nr:stage V sporulation protein B [Clostridia bacterium]